MDPCLDHLLRAVLDRRLNIDRHGRGRIHLCFQIQEMRKIRQLCLFKILFIQVSKWIPFNMGQ